jgi:hypothetical protein
MIVIEYEKKYWTGSKFSKSKKYAMTFKSSKKAWEYVDDNFPVSMAEECGLEKL